MCGGCSGVGFYCGLALSCTDCSRGLFSLGERKLIRTLCNRVYAFSSVIKIFTIAVWACVVSCVRVVLLHVFVNACM